MINKIYRIIHNQYSKFFNFFFFLKYVFLIFFVAILVFFLVPKFFNYEKKQAFIEAYLVNQYDLELNNYSSIKFNIFPLPNLSLKDTNLKIKKNSIFLNTKNLSIFLKIKNIYNIEELEAKKIILGNTQTDLNIDSVNYLISYFAKLKNNLDIKNLDLNLKKKGKNILEIKKINFSNHGYNKYKIKGKIFNKNFKAYLDEKNQNFNFKVLNTGIKVDTNFEEMNNKNYLSGSSKINILKNYLRLNFLVKENLIEVKKSNFRNKNISLSFDGFILFDPFFEVNSEIYIDKINKKLINNLSLNEIFENKDILKKLNSKNKIIYKKKRSKNSIINGHYSELDLSHGRLILINNINITGGNINCKGQSLLLEEYPRLDFNCLFNIQEKNKLLKKFSISKNINNSPVNLNIEGSLNLLNRKINFIKIDTDTNYVANEEDLKYFKETFEKILFKDGFFKMFSMIKIKEFLLDII